MKKDYYRIFLSVILFIAAFIMKPFPLVSLILYLLSYIVIGFEVLLSAFRNILHGQIFDENFLMSIASIGALSIGQYPEGVAVMLFYEVGELFQNRAVDKSRKSIASLMDIRPDYATVKRNGELITVDPDLVKIDEEIVIRPGEKIPLDGVIIDGKSSIDTAALTGESVPRDALTGDDIMSGCINLDGVITVRVTKEFGDSTVSKILDLVENASSKKSSQESFITKFARYYTPCVVAVAVLLVLIPTVFLSGNFHQWLSRALVFLVVSCPCALVISVPLSFFGGIGGASKKGILIKGGNYIEALSKIETVVFDKTGTLTKGVFNVQEINATNGSKEELLELAAFAECYSNHPIARSILKTYQKDIDKSAISEIEEIAGHGITIRYNGSKIAAGNAKLMEKLGIHFSSTDTVGTVIHVAKDNVYLGSIDIADELKKDAEEIVSLLKNAGVKKTVMLTGDSKKVAAYYAKLLSLDEYHAELLPADKVAFVEKMLNEKTVNKMLAFVGDGVNDAPVLARADVGIAMGGLGSDAAIEAADVVIMTDEPSKIGKAIQISKKTLKIANQNIYFALVVKLGVLLLGAFGFATMWEAVFADVGVTIIAILNSMRALHND